MTHLALHFILRAIIASLFYRKSWKLAYFIMIATMLVEMKPLR